jgi:hypothetical protein
LHPRVKVRDQRGAEREAQDSGGGTVRVSLSQLKINSNEEAMTSDAPSILIIDLRSWFCGDVIEPP